jgi:hypothetical protein
MTVRSTCLNEKGQFAHRSARSRGRKRTRWPSQRAKARVRQRVRELTPRARCHADIRDVIAGINPVLRGWGKYFRTGNAARKFLGVDRFVECPLRALRITRKGRNLRPSEASRWTRK